MAEGGNQCAWTRQVNLLYVVITLQLTRDTAGNERPSLKNLHDHVVLKVASKWKDIAVQLLKTDKQQMINIVQTTHRMLRSAVNVFSRYGWIRLLIDATWNQLISALTKPCVGLLLV